MVFKLLYAVCCLAQCVTTAFYINTYRTHTRNIRHKMICSSIFILAGVFATVACGRVTAFSVAMLVGFILSWVGDLFLAFSCEGTYFVLGLASFLLAHVAYVVAFCLSSAELFANAPLFGVYDAVLVAVIMAVVFAVKFACKIKFDGLGVPVFVYALAICLMLTKAVLLGVRSVSAGIDGAAAILPVVSIGAACFVASDAVLVFILFKKKTGVKPEAGNLITYYAAQMLLAGSIMLLG